jgi:hypothetical protein
MFCSSTGYAVLSGTSMASPHLTGVVALVLSHGISNQGDLTTLADDVKVHLCADTTLGYGVLSTHILPTDPRYPQYFGCGVVNAKKALIDDPPPTGTPVNHPPVAVDDSATTLAGALVTVDVLANDTDADGDTLSVTAVTSPAHGAAAVNNGKVAYTPAGSYVGSDTFDYTVSDGNGGTDTGTVNVTVNGVNHPPVAVDDSATTVAGTLVTVDVVANDTDVDGDPLSVTGVTSAAHGTAVVNNGKVNYTPSGSYTGSDTFDYTVSDGHGGTDTGTVNVTVSAVNHPPVAVDDSATTLQNTPVAVDVLANDTDIDGDILLLTGVSSPAHGTTSVVGGKVTYTPATYYIGTDTYDYTVSDGKGGTDTGTVNVTVNYPPTNTLHVGDLDDLSTLQTKGWTAKVRILVHNANHKVVAGVVVTGVFAGGVTQTCTTGSKGQCSLSIAKLSKTQLSIGFNVSLLGQTGKTYVPFLNHDPDTDSDGTTITLHMP